MVNEHCRKEVEVLNRKGFTLVELIIVLAILGILAVTLFHAAFPEKAYGAMFLNEVVETSDASISEIAGIADVTPTIQVVILIYAAEWTRDNSDGLMDAARGVQQRLEDAGIPTENIVLNFANKGGLKEDGAIDRIPEKDGVYLYIQ
jgi:prepilin-type N-terminal cleavage/methylation domain-containing protein